MMTGQRSLPDRGSRRRRWEGAQIVEDEEVRARGVAEGHVPELHAASSRRGRRRV